MIRLFRTLSLRSSLRRLPRNLWFSPGILLAVGLILAVGLMGHSARTWNDVLVIETAGQTDLVVRPSDAEHRGMPESLLRRVINMPDVTTAAPSLRLAVSLAERENVGAYDPGLLPTRPDPKLSLLAVDPDRETRVRIYNIPEGRFLSQSPGADEIVLGIDFASQQELKLGQQIALQTAGGVERLQVVGLLDLGGMAQVNDGAFGIIPLSAGQRMAGRQGQIDAIDIIAFDDEPEALAALQAQLQDRLGQGYAVVSPLERTIPLPEGWAVYRRGLYTVSGLLLSIGIFLLVNVFSMEILDRQREIKLLRTLGLVRQRLFGVMLGEGLFLGVVVAVLGIGVGLLLVRALALLSGIVLGFTPPLASPPFMLLLLCFLFGVLAVVLAVLIPAWGAGRIGLLNSRPERPPKETLIRRYFWILGLALWGLAAWAFLSSPDLEAMPSWLCVLLLAAAFSGAVLLAPVLLWLWAFVTRPINGLIFGRSGRFAGGGLTRSRPFTALAMVSLMAGVGVALAGRAVWDSAGHALANWVRADLGAELAVTSSAGLPPEAWRRLDAVEGVQASASLSRLDVRWRVGDGSEALLAFKAVQPPDYQHAVGFPFSDPQADQGAAVARLAGGGSVFISSLMSERQDLSVGDSIELRTASGWRSFEIAGVVVDFSNQGRVVVGSQLDLARWFEVEDASSGFLRIAAGSSIEEVQTRIESRFGDLYQLNMVPRDSIFGRYDRSFGGVRWAVAGLGILTIVFTALGVSNTLVINVMARRDEFILLRGAGMTRSQVALMVVLEGGFMGMVGGALGLGFGWLLVRLVPAAVLAVSGLRLAYALPVDWMAVCFGTALIVSLAASLAPARRAARLSSPG